MYALVRHDLTMRALKTYRRRCVSLRCVAFQAVFRRQDLRDPRRTSSGCWGPFRPVGRVIFPQVKTRI